MSVTAASVTEHIAYFAATLALDAVPAPALQVARACLQDLIGVTLAGVGEEAARLGARWVAEEGGRPDATVFGTALRTSAANAAFANGIAGHALDLDDVSLAMRGHPSVVAGQAALAVAEASGASGADLLAGYVAGVETTIALGFGIGRTHYIAGWHSTATLGTVGAAAAAARVRGLDADTTRLALGIAASLASGMRCNFGSMTKPLHAGHAARNGVMAAALAAAGFTANARALESPIGFFALFSDDADPRRTVERLGTQWALVSPGINIKRHPCCYGTHHAIDAVLALRAAHAIDAATVRRIVVRVAPGGMAALIHDRPESGLQGKFSLPYTVASALIDGAPTLATFEDTAVRRVDVQACMERVEYVEAQGAPVTGDDPRFAEVTLHLDDGRVLDCRIDHPRGSPEAPLTQDQLDRKFVELAEGVLGGKERALAALVPLHAIDHLHDMRDLTAALTAPKKEI